MVFSGGHHVRVIGTNAETLTRTLNLPSTGPVRTAWGALPEGWVNIQTEDEGTILVNPGTVAYVRDVPDVETVEHISRLSRPCITPSMSRPRLSSSR
jgi:hypothetical protein